jgi:ribulose-5-phosphate 4-epimerase/fuculose-1-phosphate aldolase
MIQKSPLADLEGVTKFENEFKNEHISALRYEAQIGELKAWRAFMMAQGILGQDPGRYEGVGFGNLSARIGPYSAPQGKRPFLVTGTQTNTLSEIDRRHFSIVDTYDIRGNRLQSHGPVAPSSESLTHGAIYDLSSSVRFVMHGHAPLLFQYRKQLHIPTTGVNIPYGTVAMAQEMRRLHTDSTVGEKRIIAMDSHEDGIITFGKTAWDAGETMLRFLIQALKVNAQEAHASYSFKSPRQEKP